MAQGSGHLRRKAIFPVSCLANSRDDGTVWQMAHVITVYLGGQAWLDYFLQVVFPEVLLQSAQAFEGQRRLAFLGAKGHYLTRLFLPLIDDRGICRDLNRSPVLLEAHTATESLVV